MATALQDFRDRHPEFDQLSDFEVADGLRRKYNRTTGESADVRSFFESIGGPALGPTIELGTRAEREAAGTLSPAEGGPPLPPLGETPVLTQPPAAGEALAPPSPATVPQEGTPFSLPEPGTPAAQLTGENLQAQITGGRELEESIGRFARGQAPDERVARRNFRAKEDVAKRTREILGDAQKETATEAKDRREAFQESALGPDTVLGQITGVTMNLIPMTLALFALQNTSDPDVIRDVRDSFGPFEQDPREAAARRLRSVASGAVGVGAGIVGFLGTKTNIEALQSGALTAQGIAEGLMPRDPAFIEELGSGFGSSATFWIPGVGIARGAQAIGKVSTVAALWAGAAASGVMEAMAEAGNTFQGLIDQGVDPEEAERRADQVFLENSAVVTLFNRFGLFGQQAGQFARVTLTAASEGVQEWFQQIIGNLAADDPLLQGTGKATLIGSLVGGAAATATPGGVLPGERAPGPEGGPFPAGGPGFQPPVPTEEEVEAIAADQPEAPPRTVFTPRGEELEVTPRVVDVNELVTSHDDAGNINPDFPARLQPRAREGKTSQVQIAKIAGSLNPALLGDTPSITEGAPIIARMPKEDAEGNPVLNDQGSLIMQDVVISGNARVIAARQALTDERGQAFREATPEIAAEFGLTPQQVEPFADPMVVRELAEDVDLVEFARQANEPAVAQFSPAEQARSDAARLTADDLTLFNPDQTGNPLAASNEPFLRIFLQRIGAEGAAGMTTAEGKPTKQLADRMNAAIFARVYGDERLIQLQAEEADPQIRNILAALQAAAPAFAKAKAIDENLGGLNVPEKIVDAVQLIRDVQARGGTLEQMLDQADLFGDADAEVTGFARFIAANNRSADRMGRAFSTIAEFLQTEVARQQTADIFGDKGASLPELLAAANREIEKANAAETQAAGGTQGDIFGANPPTGAPAPGPEPTPPAGDIGGQPTGQPGAAAPPPTAAPGAAQPDLTDAEINDAVERMAGLTEGRTEEVVKAIANGAKLTELARIIGKGTGGFGMARKATKGSVTVTSDGSSLSIKFGPDQVLRLTPGEIGRRLKVILGGETIFVGPEKRARGARRGNLGKRRDGTIAVGLSFPDKQLIQAETLGPATQDAFDRETGQLVLPANPFARHKIRNELHELKHTLDKRVVKPAKNTKKARAEARRTEELDRETIHTMTWRVTQAIRDDASGALKFGQAVQGGPARLEGIFKDGDQVRVIEGKFNGRQGQIQEEPTGEFFQELVVSLSPFGRKAERPRQPMRDIQVEMERTIEERDADRGVPTDAEQDQEAGAPDADVQPPGGAAPGEAGGGGVPAAVGGAGVRAGGQEVQPPTEPEPTRTVQQVTSAILDAQAQLREQLRGADDLTPASRDQLREAAAEELKALRKELSGIIADQRAAGAKTPTAAEKRTAATLRTTADKMQRAIDDKLDPATAGQNATPRRARIIDSMQADGRRLAKIQTRLRNIAAALDGGQLPAILVGVKSKAMVEDLMRAELPAGQARKEANRAAKALITTQAQWEEARAALDSLEGSGPATDSVVEARRLFDKLKRDLVGVKGVGVDFFPTPPERARELVEQADAQGAQEGQAGDSVLEASAGSGNIVEAMAELYKGFDDITITALEVSPRLVEVLRAQAEALRDTHAVDVQQGDFLEYTVEHDVIVMNPPFSKNRDIDHVRHAWDLLSPGGRLVAVMSEHAFIAGGKKERDFRDWLDDNGGTHVELDPGDLADKKVTQRSTVKGRVIELNKPAGEDVETSGPGVLSERDTTYEIREPERADQGPDQLTLFAPEDAPKPPAEAPKLKPEAKPRVKQVATGVIRSGLDVVNSVAEAAHVLAPIRKDAQETFVALVLGKGNKILRVIRHSVGRVAGSTVDVGIMAGTVAETPGAQTVYFAHNHPSGRPQQSKDDRAMTEKLADVLEGTGIEMVGGIVVAPGSITATVLPIINGVVHGQTDIVIPAAPRRVAIPVTERRLRRLAQEKGAPTTGSQQSRVLLTQQEGEGVLLLDQANRPLKWVPMSTQQMLKLRTGVVGTGASKLQQEITQQNATGALIKTKVKNDGSLKGLRNVGDFLEANRIRLLDGFLEEKDGTLTSLAERNMPAVTFAGTFEMRDVPPGATPELDVEEDSLDSVRTFIDKAGGSVLITSDVDGDLSLDIVELPPRDRGQGIGTEFMERLTAHADRFGRDIKLTPHPLDINRKRAERAADVARLVKFYSRFGFQQDHTGSHMFRTAETPPAPVTTVPPGTLPVTVETEKIEAGVKHVSLLRDQDLPVDTTGAPRKPASGFGVFKTPIAPDKPLRREPILRNIERDFGVRIYQGRIKGNRTALGFYRNHIEELRLKDNNAIEVAAHEIAHFMDDLDPRFKAAYKDKRFKDEIRSVSYDITKLNEGFAEFVRLFLTQEEEAVAQAPGFYDEFVRLIEGSRFEKGLTRAQRDMHAWFRQGATNRALSKIGKDRTLNGRVQDIWRAMEDFADRPGDLAIDAMLDKLQGVKIAERTITGTIGDADMSAYKIMRLVAGIRGVVRAVFRKGTIGYATNGDVIFTGAGLEQVFKPIADVMDDAMAYFAGKRADELFRQNRENLMSRSEIQALIDKGKGNERIVKAFKDYRAFNARMMQFYQDSGLLSAQSRAIIEELNKSYVPFHRIVELATGQVKRADRAAFKRLRGGTANLDDIYGNIMQSVAALVDAAVKNKAKQRVYGLIQRGKGAAQFAARIPRETQAVQLDSKQVASKVKGILEEIGIDLAEVLPEGGMTFGEDFETAAGQFMTFFTFGNEPIGDNIDSVMFNGRRTYFEVADPLFLSAMLSLGPQATNWALRIGLGFKHTLTFGVTAMPDFLIPNLTRDSVSGWLLRRSNMLPVISSIRGMVDRMQKSDAYWEYLANGGGFAASVQVETGSARRNLERLYTKSGIPFKNVITNPRRLIDWWVEFGSAFEYGTRLAEFKASRKQGKSAAESTFRGRDVSTDFAMRGSSDFLRYFTSSVPFLNARAQGLYKLEREVFEKEGKQVLRGDKQWQLARRSLMLILPTLILWGLNRDDERYKALEPWVKDLHWVIFVPGKDEPILIMKPFEMGMLFGSIPERIAEVIVTQDGEQFADALWFMLTEQVNMNLIPQVINPGYEHARNRNWMGGKIIPDDLANVDNNEQFRPWSSDTSILLGEKIGLSPLLFDHYVKGYLGTMGMYALMASDGLISGTLPEAPEKEWSDRPVIRRFTRSLPLRRTQYEDEFYELRQEVRRITSTFNKIRAEGRDPGVYLDEAQRAVLFAASKTVSSVSREISALNGAIRRTRLSGVLSPREKTAEIKKLRRSRNKLFKDATDALSPAQLETLRKNLERE